MNNAFNKPPQLRTRQLRNATKEWPVRVTWFSRFDSKRGVYVTTYLCTFCEKCENYGVFFSFFESTTKTVGLLFYL